METHKEPEEEKKQREIKEKQKQKLLNKQYTKFSDKVKNIQYEIIYLTKNLSELKKRYIEIKKIEIKKESREMVPIENLIKLTEDNLQEAYRMLEDLTNKESVSYVFNQLTNDLDKVKHIIYVKREYEPIHNPAALMGVLSPRIYSEKYSQTRDLYEKTINKFNERKYKVMEKISVCSKYLDKIENDMNQLELDLIIMQPQAIILPNIDLIDKETEKEDKNISPDRKEKNKPKISIPLLPLTTKKTHHHREPSQSNKNIFSPRSTKIT